MTDDTPSFSSDDVISSAAQGRLQSFVERIERLEEDKAVVANDLKEVYAEAKGEGFDVKILRKVVRIRKQDAAKLSEEEALIDLYMSAIDGKAAAKAERTGPEPTPLDRAIAVQYLRRAAKHLQSHPEPFTIRDLANVLTQPFETTRAVVELMQSGGMCTAADGDGKRKPTIDAGIDVDAACDAAIENCFNGEGDRPAVAKTLDQKMKDASTAAEATVVAIEAMKAKKGSFPPGTTISVNGGPEVPLGSPEASKAIEGAVRRSLGQDDSDDDETLYKKAVHFVTTDRKASTAYVQRKLQIGYNRASDLIERMERAGIIGAANRVGKRDILQGPAA